MAEQLPKTYSHKEVEDKWYSFWEKKNYFHADPNPEKEKYCIVIPPPNITGILTMGHVLNNTIQDILIRWHRMKGKETLWLPGTDHAGIATQNRVERVLEEDDIHREDIGREKFVERVWEWREEYGGTIIRQLRKLGYSCDWDRERFTLDEGLSKAVREAFVQLYEKGLIYKGNYIVNWCPRCHTALSDDEVEHEDHDGHLWYIKYPVEETDDELLVATTRPETMLGDTALAVHPDDERYQHLIGKHAILPILNRRIPIIADPILVDREFGTGVVKVTPAHDPNDFLAGKRNGLEEIVVMDTHATMNKNAGSEYKGLDRFECREKLIMDLEEDKYLAKIEPYEHSVGHCYRCHCVIEPYLSKQWFIDMEPLAKPALKAVEEKKIRFHPERWVKVYQHWLENIRPWCISRQLWWGHRIPVWYCDDCSEVTVSREDPTTCAKCGSANIHQDEDVLDTWASSWLWPFSTLGWPEETDELSYFYSTDDLVTAPDIIFFWVARMIMAGLEFMDEIPFSDVYFTGMIRDMQGRKMSKSLGNSPDPLDVIDEYGADALRFTISYLSPLGQDIYYSNDKCEIGRNFANKIWNASRFLLMNLDDFDPDTPEPTEDDLTLADKWIISEYNKAIKAIETHLSKYHFTDTAKSLYDFIWHVFCDWYLELIKNRLYNPKSEKDRTTAQYIALTILESSLRLLHPVMPFITEEIWQKLPNKSDESIMIASYPEFDKEKVDNEAIAEMELIMDIIGAIRNIRGEMNVPPGKKANAMFKIPDESVGALIGDNQIYIKELAKIEDITIGTELEKPKASASSVVSGIEIFIPLKGLIDFEVEKKRLQKELDKTKIDIDRSEKKLNNKDFLTKAPEAVVEKERKKYKEYQKHLEKVKNNLEKLQ